MIDQMTGMMPLTGTERVQRSSVNNADSSFQDISLSSMQGGMDTTSLSPAALAMAKNVPPAGESAEQGKTGPDESENVAENSLEKRIDIRV
ncbi:MAG: hypothetical protein ABIJ50_14605 [Pseudomonadota bacterium]